MQLLLASLFYTPQKLPDLDPSTEMTSLAVVHDGESKQIGADKGKSSASAPILDARAIQEAESAAAKEREERAKQTQKAS